MNLVRSSVGLLVAKVGGALLIFAGVALFARQLSMEEIGAFFLFEALIGIFSIPGDLGIRRAVEKRISETEVQPEVVLTGAGMKLGLFVVIAAALLAFETVVNDYLGYELAAFLVVALFLHETGQFTMSILRGQLRVEETAVMEFLRRATWFLVSGALILEGMGVFALIYGSVTGLAVLAGVGLLKQDVQLAAPEFSAAKSLFWYAKFSALSNVGGYLYSWIDIIVIGLLLTNSAVAAYEVAWRVTGVVGLFSYAIGAALFPQFSQWDSERTVERIVAILPDAFTASLALVVPAFAGCIILSTEILTLLFGPEYAVASLVLVILMFEKILQAVRTVVVRSLQAINRPDQAAVGSVLGIAANVVFNLALVYAFGLPGAAVATTSAMLITTSSHLLFLSRHIDVGFDGRSFAWITVATVGMAVVVEGFTRVHEVETFPGLVVVISLGAVVYGVLILASPYTRTQVRGLYRSVAPG